MHSMGNSAFFAVKYLVIAFIEIITFHSNENYVVKINKHIHFEPCLHYMNNFTSFQDQFSLLAKTV